MTPKRARFIAEYLVDLNATQAALRAGFSRKTAYSQGQRLLKLVEIQSAVQVAMASREKRTEITQDRVLRELALIGLGDPRLLFDGDGNLLPIAALSDEAARMVASVEVTRERTQRHGETTIDEAVTKVRQWDKVRALEIIAKHLGMLKDRVVFENPPPFRIVHDDAERHE